MAVVTFIEFDVCAPRIGDECDFLQEAEVYRSIRSSSLRQRVEENLPKEDFMGTSVMNCGRALDEEAGISLSTAESRIK